MKLVTLTAAVMAAAITSTATQAEMFVQPSYGATWIQSDYNSNHGSMAGSLDFGYKAESQPFNVVVGYTYSSQSDHATSQNTQNLRKRTTFEYDYDMHGLTVWLMPKVTFGNFELSTGPGVGLIYDSMDLVTSEGLETRRNGFEFNLSLRADLMYKVNDKWDIGLVYRQDYFEVDTNRDVSDYEVNQDRSFYFLSAKYSF